MMLVRSEYSYRVAFGSIDAVLARLPDGGCLVDTGCWGHVPFAKAAMKAGKRWGLGARVRIGTKKDWRELCLVARTNGGLKELYRLVTLAAAQEGRLALAELPEGGGRELLTVVAPGRAGTPPSAPPGAVVPYVPGLLRGSALAFSDNYYPAVEDRDAWQFAVGRPWIQAAPAWIMNDRELLAEGAPPAALAGNAELMAEIELTLPKAENIKFPCADAQEELTARCWAELVRRGLGQEYQQRLTRELEAVAEKGFADYFLVIAELVAWTKKRQLVGPGRGSSAGSIVCWLLRITEVDPLVHGLLFERFIDTNRHDLPDVDLDFMDTGREEVLQHLADLYGAQNVAHIGTVMRFKPKSALTDCAKALKIPDWKLSAVKDVIIERSSGDSRVNNCLQDTIEASESGKKLIEEYPELKIAYRLEGAARQSGKHAAGMIVCNEAVETFCAVGAGRVAQIDKKSAEALNILKIDALGLRTLSVLETALEFAGMNREELYALPLDDTKAFDIFNAGRWSGIFQFEGRALQSLAAQVTISRFDDLAALTALARPGPLASGAATRWIEKREGREPPTPAHPALAELTKSTFGEIIYQESVMTICRQIGGFSWADTAAIRKLMSNRVGDEAFRKFDEQFMKGAAANGVSEVDAAKIWKAINTFGSWSFNLSHAVVYGLISYWTAWMKANHPLAFAAGCLRHAKDTDSALAVLRELTREGIEYTAVDPALSDVSWTVREGKLLGGLTGIPGIGTVTANKIMIRRENGMELTEGQRKLLLRPSVFSNPFPCRKLWGHIYKDPYAHNIVRAPLVEIDQIFGPGEYVIIGKLVKKQTRDMNEEISVQKRGGQRIEGPHHTLLFFVEDDTGRRLCQVNRWKYDSLGKDIVDNGVVGESWLMLRGIIREGNWDGFGLEALRWLKPAR